MTEISAALAWEALYRAQVSVMRDLRIEFSDQGLTMNEYDVMSIVARQPEQRIRLRALTSHVLITQSSVSRLVDRLVARGLLDKCGDPEDARGAIVCMTPFGRTEFERADRVHEANIRARLGHLSASERADLAAICGKLIGSWSGSGSASASASAPDAAGASA